MLDLHCSSPNSLDPDKFTVVTSSFTESPIWLHNTFLHPHARERLHKSEGGRTSKAEELFLYIDTLYFILQLRSAHSRIGVELGVGAGGQDTASRLFFQHGGRVGESGAHLDDLALEQEDHAQSRGRDVGDVQIGRHARELEVFAYHGSQVEVKLGQNTCSLVELKVSLQ